MKPKSSQISFPYKNCLINIFLSEFKESLSSKEVLFTTRQAQNLVKNNSKKPLQIIHILSIAKQLHQITHNIWNSTNVLHILIFI